MCGDDVEFAGCVLNVITGKYESVSDEVRYKKAGGLTIEDLDYDNNNLPFQRCNMNFNLIKVIGLLNESITRKGVAYCLGRFSTAEAAYTAYVYAKKVGGLTIEDLDYDNNNLPFQRCNMNFNLVKVIGLLNESIRRKGVAYCLNQVYGTIVMQSLCYMIRKLIQEI